MRLLPVSAFLLAAALAAAGCRGPAAWRAKTDRRAGALLGAAQREVSGREEAVVVETPADTLRRRLMLDQSLPAFDPAAYGLRDLPETDLWKPGRILGAGDDADGGTAAAPGGTNALEVGFADAVRLAAAGSREYQARKDALYAAALALDLEGKAFRTAFEGAAKAAAETASGGEGEDRVSSHGETASFGLSRETETGASISGKIAFNLAGMLRGDRRTAWGTVADLGVNIPLLRGAGRLVRRESLTQAERDLVYAVRDFEQYKRDFAVDVEKACLELVLAGRRRDNERDNYSRVRHSTARSRRMADASRMSKAAFDQSAQSELAARATWISACQSYEAALEAFKMKLGLPPDARVAPREADLQELCVRAEAAAGEDLADTADAEPEAGPAAVSGGVPAPPESVDSGALKERVDRATALAFERRLDVRTARDRVEDAQRHLAVAADALRAELTIGGSARVGESASPALAASGEGHAPFRMKDGSASGVVSLDLPFERTAERVSHRNALLALERAVRDYQEAEDALKQAVRRDLRALSLGREQFAIQRRAVALAARRVRNQDLLLEAGRADMTDVLDAQAALVAAQNSLYGAITSLRGDELRLQADLGVLDVSADGVWSERDLFAEGIF